MIPDNERGFPNLAAIREAELRDAEQHCADSFEAYWAGSASASVMRDYAAGRLTDPHRSAQIRSVGAMNDRSMRAEVRNPLIALPSFRALSTLGNDERAALHALLLELRADARLRAAECWRRRKPPMAAYWAAVGVYAGHAARALRPPTR